MRLIDKINSSTFNPDVLFDKKGLTTFVNPYSYYLLRKNESIIDNLDNVFIDGISLVYFFRLFNLKAKRYSFDMTSIVPVLVDYCIRNEKSVYFIGSLEKEINSSILLLKRNYPDLNVIGYRHGYFKTTDSYNSVLDEIVKLNPDIVVCGMGTPKQEGFLIDLNSAGFKGVSFTCGGFLHQSAPNLYYYPKFIDRLNLRWLYRIIDEPKLLKRYLFLYPLAFVFIFKDLCVFKLKEKKNIKI